MWEEIYPILLIILAVLLGIILFMLLTMLVAHKRLFKDRYTKDPDINYYTKEEYNMVMVPVEFKVKRNTVRGGIYYNRLNEYKGVIVFCHGMFSSIHSYMQEIGYFASKGYKVLAVNYTGIDSSDGKNYKGFGHSLQCIDEAIKFAKSHSDLSKYEISVVGHSWGGFAALNIQKYHKDIKKVVAISPFVSIHRLLLRFLPKWTYFILPMFVFVDSLKCGKYSYANALRTLKKKDNVLIISSPNDHMVNYNYNIKKLIDTNKNLSSIIVDGKYHNPHYTMEAVNLLLEYSSKMRLLDERGKLKLKRNTDFHKLGELDIDIMDKALEFIG